MRFLHVSVLQNVLTSPDLRKSPDLTFHLPSPIDTFFFNVHIIEILVGFFSATERWFSSTYVQSVKINLLL